MITRGEVYLVIEGSKMAASVSLAKRTKVFLLGCGCFNPVTHMHLRMFGKCFRLF